MNATDVTAAIFGSLISLLLVAGLYVWVALALSAVFGKSGVEPWKAWVPILNTVVVLQLAGLSPWLVILAFVPVLNIAFLILWVFALYRVNAAFGLGIGMTVLSVLLLPIWASIVGWGSARWVGREEDASSRDALAPGVRRTGEAGVRRTGDTAPSLPPLASFAAPAPRTAESSGFAGGPAPQEPAGTPAFAPSSGFAPEPASASAPAPGFAPPPPYTPAVGGDSGALRPASAFDPTAGAFESASFDSGVLDSGPAPLRAASAQPPVVTPPAEVPRAVTPPPVGAAASAEALPGVVPTAGWGSPPAPGRPVSATPFGSKDADPAGERWQGFALDSTDLSAEVTGAVPGAPAPISAVGTPAAASPGSDARAAAGSTPTTAVPGPSASPAALPVPEVATTSEGVTRPPLRRDAGENPDGREPWAPARSPMSDGDAFPEASGPVSAIAGAPDAGAPRSARTSVSAYHAKPEIPEEQDVFDETIIARRKRTGWTLVPPTGDPVALSSDVVILGRRPTSDPAYPGAQLVSIQDGTVSKTHARLQLRGDRWYVTDLGSTNGVLFATVMGTEVEAPSGEEVEAGDRFLLGDAEVRLQRRDG
ncbi:DUF5684 domain-containing protein [Microbacterium timonense]|uniref:DUF5684 domain-containing protein n=1 Tax=Microbacterium timonense TaxID=2086576 RepID=UPI000D0E4A38|nr:DUF5684 domain-containing protein [Microbacterium timonense]